MRSIFIDIVSGIFLGICFIIFCLVIASFSSSAYAKDLSKSVSVTPQRHCGFIVPHFCNAPQATQNKGTSVLATHTRLKSLYEGMTLQNMALPNMQGGSYRPRVNPLTLISQISVTSKTQNCKERINHA